MKKYNVCCLNTNCELGKKFSFQMEIDEREDNDEQICPCCGETIKIIGEVTYIGGDFSNLPSSQKKESLVKRSREHFKKHIKEKKDWMDKNF